MKRFLPLLILPLLVWVACEDAENEADSQLCTSEVEAMNAASEALENAEGVAEIAAAILTACESINETIQCMSESSLFTQEDVDEMQASYDEICGGLYPYNIGSNLCLNIKPRPLAGFFVSGNIFINTM